VGARENVTFGRVGGSLRADYLVADGSGGIRVWKNEGRGGARVSGDGDRYCDMTGSGTVSLSNESTLRQRVLKILRMIMCGWMRTES
jgi:hypothetical protein